MAVTNMHVQGGGADEFGECTPIRRWSSTCREGPRAWPKTSLTRWTAMLAGAMRPQLGKCGILADARPLHPPGVHAATTTTSACGWVQRSAGWGLKPPPRTLSPKGFYYLSALSRTRTPRSSPTVRRRAPPPAPAIPRAQRGLIWLLCAALKGQTSSVRVKR